MAAPALVALAHGSRDPRSAATITALVDEVRALRPDLRIETAFLELAKPSLNTVVDKLARAAFEEVVVVPLLLTDAHHANVDVPAAVAEADARHEGMQVRATSILGLEACFLEVLDVRMREALKAARVRELDALVLAAAGSSDALANQSVARLARLWGSHHKLPVTAAFASAAPPATGEAVRAVPQGGPPPHRGRLAVPGPGLPARPGQGARARGRRRRRGRARSASTRPWPARSWPATPSARSSWSRSSRAA